MLEREVTRRQQKKDREASQYFWLAVEVEGERRPLNPTHLKDRQQNHTKEETRSQEQEK